mmetsp:Transcript_14463/g.31358  ORF Transcript_14463/g.31358 Transcript_14463/m.31358 type:complete len:439 (+) Transcript_14463:114-1430(+)|eukprot:CAMPEP_0202906590 /NCGR_PEP_ID=MMETSP1392-20130828/39637_1 /ASSEMBLY_ACC=CAM_ASM_000868 /TAXON_ID=225041 /ORGANISM="Chlamydomonas chlamydogama, Strain SAG 11-48b" /LENGTH=438 /DNA_ID=CAMNT_0049595189 /DNA_START=56 /DNA_END=1372 /DNA_ORIENTATION=+
MPKPRARQRIVFCDCFDCIDRQAPSVASEAALQACDAAARQEPPPKALVLYGSGFLRSCPDGINVDICTMPHLDKIVVDGSLGLLAVRKVDDRGPLSASTKELSQVLGVYEELLKAPEASDMSGLNLPSLQSRFKGMAGSFASTSTEAQQLANTAGCALPAGLQLSHKGSGLPQPDAYAAQIMAELGAEGAAGGLDLLMVHLDVHDLAKRQAAGADGDAAADEVDVLYDASLEGLEWLDGLVKELLHHASIKEQTIVVLMLSAQGQPLSTAAASGGGGKVNSLTAPAATERAVQQAAAAAGVALDAPASPLQLAQDLTQPGGADIDPAAYVVTPRSAMMAMASSSGASAALGILDEVPCSTVVRPVQSFQKLGQADIETQADAHVIVARRLPGVIRRDRSERLSLQECHMKGSQGCILADRMLPEVAYKLARAGKYGA